MGSPNTSKKQTPKSLREVRQFYIDNCFSIESSIDAIERLGIKSIDVPYQSSLEKSQTFLNAWVRGLKEAILNESRERGAFGG